MKRNRLIKKSSTNDGTTPLSASPKSQRDCAGWVEREKEEEDTVVLGFRCQGKKERS